MPTDPVLAAEGAAPTVSSLDVSLAEAGGRRLPRATAES